jgi:hypothetical protein
VLNFQFNVALVKCSVITTKSSHISVQVVGYKYIQRARLVKSQRLALLIATGVFKNKPPLYHVRMAQGFVLPAAIIIKLEQMLKTSFGQEFELSFFNISNAADQSFGLSKKLQAQLKDFVRDQK